MKRQQHQESDILERGPGWPCLQNVSGIESCRTGLDTKLELAQRRVEVWKLRSVLIPYSEIPERQEKKHNEDLEEAVYGVSAKQETG